MDLAFLDGSTVSTFVTDQKAFDKSVDELFARLDTDGDGVLSRSELVSGLEGLLMLASKPSCAAEPESPSSLWLMGKDDVHSVFEKFDKDRSGSVDRTEFGIEIKEIMLAVVRGLGDSPVQVALDKDNFLMRALEHEQSCSACERQQTDG